ncbi:MAG TPA: NAD(P)H-hydrate dehydratase [Bryobacteraceae bacterium]|nr:NAD(P)H-hydrate dehydratase [Bryobacteraceae bacterium]
MKVLTVAQMREVDRRTIAMGIPGIVLMENAAHRVVEFLAERFAPLAAQRIAVLCGKGNNGGDGLAIARQLFTRFHPRALHVVLLAAPEELKGDAATNYRILEVCGCPAVRELPAEARNATLVVDALLGTGITGPATGRMLEGIREINKGFPLAKVVAVDIPSGMPTDTGEPAGECARADATVTFTAPKIAQVMPPNCDHVGHLVVGAIGSPPSLYDDVWLSLVEPPMFRSVLAPRPPGGHKGTFGHVLVVAGSRGKTGAAAMTGLGALRAGAGLVTVASAESAIPEIASHAPELMTEPLAETPMGSIALNASLEAIAEGKTVIAMGPGLGRHRDIDMLVASAAERFTQPMVLDADALAASIAGSPARVRVLTPHPGEMARLTGKTTAAIQKDRIGAARAFAAEHGVTLVLKGQRTVIAFPDGRVWINPTGTPALGTGGSGDVLTGMIAGFLAQFPIQPDRAVAAAVYLHGLAGEVGARALGEKSLIATDALKYLPEAVSLAAALAGPVEACADVPHGL